MHRQNGESELCYKDIDETMMPYCFDCPQKILKQLTPTDNEYAKQWRSLCEQWQYRKLLLRKCRQTDDTLPSEEKMIVMIWNYFMMDYIKNG